MSTRWTKPAPRDRQEMAIFCTLIAKVKHIVEETDLTASEIFSKLLTRETGRYPASWYNGRNKKPRISGRKPHPQQAHRVCQVVAAGAAQDRRPQQNGIKRTALQSDPNQN